MKIINLTINNIGGISNLALEFNKGFNFICGPNGIGKTTVLECVAHAFSASSTDVLKRNVVAKSGLLTATIESNDEILTAKFPILEFEPNARSHISGLYQHARKVLSIKVTRALQYQDIDAVRKDRETDDYNAYEEAKNGVNSQEVKNWFVNRFLYSAHPGTLTPEQIHNLDLAKRCFSLLNDSFRFSHVMASSNEIMVSTPSGIIYFEYLSSGFKSCIAIIFGIIKDIEFRFKSPTLKADEFDGIIIIDELELHLHPEWQSRISKVLSDVFPNAQFIVATHSPHIIQAASPKEIIALSIDDNGNVVRRPLINSKFGFQGWTIEEVLVDVMGMTDTRTPIFHQVLEAYESALESEDATAATAAFDTLNQLLHPQNPLRKIFQLDLASLRGAEA